MSERNGTAPFAAAPFLNYVDPFPPKDRAHVCI